MEIARERIVGNQTVGLRVRDNGIKLSNNSVYSKNLAVADGKTTIMAVTASGKNFMVDSNGKIDEKGRIDDIDETSSGYSSRESHCGENQDTRFNRSNKPLKKTSKNAKAIQPIELNDKLPVIEIQEEGSLEGICGTADETPSLLLEESEVLDRSFDEKDDHPRPNFTSTASQTIENSKNGCSGTCKTCSCQRDFGPSRGDQRIFRQPRVVVQNHTVQEDHLPPDKFVKPQRYLDDPKHKVRQDREGKGTQEIEVQPGRAVPELLEECSKLKEFNLELEARLVKSNVKLNGIVQELERELKNAVTEISRLRTQLRAVDKKKLQLHPCSRCGYHSEGETVERQPSSKSYRTASAFREMQKAASLDSLNKRAVQGTKKISLRSEMLKSLLKGQNPDKIKMTLLEKNKSLKDEIKNLKEVEPQNHTATLSTLSSEANTKDGSCNITGSEYDAVVTRRTSTEPEIVIKTKQKQTQEDVRWRQQIKFVRRPKRTSSVHPQYTSAAFRTIHVTKWGQKS